MKKSALVLAVVTACGLAPQAFAHELAYSKKDHIKVEVPGEATTWCKPEIELTIRRPVWDNQDLLGGLISKLPLVLGKDCPTATVTWKAVDASGNLYARGAGTSANLGIPSWAAAEGVPAAPAPSTASEMPAPVATAPMTPPAARAAEQVPSPTHVVEAPTSAPAAQPEVPAAPVQPQVAASIRPAVAAEQQPSSSDQTTSLVPETQAAVAVTPTADFGRSLVIAHADIALVTDAAGCKWVLSKSTLEDGDGSLAFSSTPAMPCQASGFAEGSFEKLSWKIPNTYRGDNWNRVYVHPSGLMFAKGLADAVQGKALSYLSPKADQALFLLGEIPGRQMKVYLAFQRGAYRVLRPFNSDPYYVVTTPDESFALDMIEYKRTAQEVFQLIKSTSPTTVDVENFYVAKTLDALYPASGWGDDKQKIVRNRLGESRGQFYFDVQEGSNWAMQREQQRLGEERRRQEQLAEIHTRVLVRYEQIKAGMKDFEGRETEALAQMAGIKVRFSSPLLLQNPNTSERVSPMMVHVIGKSGDYYEINFPSKGRLVADQEFGKEWYVVQVANMTPYLPLEDGQAIPTFRAYSIGEPDACKQDHCADKVSFGAVLAKEFPGAGIDFSWTPEVSQQYVNTWKNASSQLQ
jgi:hypothetical protein